MSIPEKAIVVATPQASTAPDFGTVAHRLVSLGLAVLPIHHVENGVCSCCTLNCPSPAKHPRVSGGSHSATKIFEVIDEWARQFPIANVGVATGKISNVVVLDVDDRHDGSKSLAELEQTHGALPRTWTVVTGGGGRHVYFAAPVEPLTNRVSVRPGLDIRADGGYVVAPPSVHVSGNAYRWAIGCAPEECPLASMPEWLYELVRTPSGGPPPKAPAAGEISPEDLDALHAAASKYIAAASPAAEGTRNSKAFNLAGHLAAFCVRGSGARLMEPMVVVLLRAWNATNVPPLPDDEIASVVHSAFESGTPRETKWIDPDTHATASGGIASVTIMLALSFDCIVDPRQGAVFVRIPRDGVEDIYPVRGDQFRGHLQHSIWETEHEVVSDAVLTAAVKLATFKAQASAERHAVDVRVTGDTSEMHLDMCDTQRRVIRVNAEGYSIQPGAGIPFYRPDGQEALPEPVAAEGALNEFRELINVKDEWAWTLLLGWLLGALCPCGPYFALSICGPQGSAKSSLTRMLRRLIDAHSVKPRGMSPSVRDLMVAASRNRVLAFDNLSGLSREMSDAFCRIATDGGYGQRRLYSDSDEAIFVACRPVVFNGIARVVNAADLLDRTILLELPSIGDVERQTERALNKRFEQMWPGVLDALLKAVALSIRQLESTKLRELPRMADAAQWIVAGIPALGVSGEKFLEALKHNRAVADEQAVEASPIGDLLLQFVDAQGEKKHWQGDGTTLLAELNRLRTLRDGTRVHGPWPKNAALLGTALTQIEPNLARLGVVVHRRKSNGHRVIEIQRVMVRAVDARREVA